jgi:hypothetical protein
MDSGSRFLTFTSVIMLALILQVFLAVADQRDAPEKAAVEFAEAYFGLDPSMANRLCPQIAQASPNEVVASYLERVGQEARSLGYSFEYMKQGLYHIDTQATLKDPTTAEVRLKGERRRIINPVFGLVARWFSVGETHPVDETLSLVKEGESWKVCGKPFQLIES